MSHARDVVYKSKILGVAVHSCTLPEGEGCGTMGNHNTIYGSLAILVRSPGGGGGGGGGGTLIFAHIRRLGPFFWVQNSEFQYFLGFSEK